VLEEQVKNAVMYFYLTTFVDRSLNIDNLKILILKLQHLIAKCKFINKMEASRRVHLDECIST